MKGEIACILSNMSDRYGVRLSKQQAQLMTVWAKQDPIDAWERERNLRIKKVQGNGNKFVY